MPKEECGNALGENLSVFVFSPTNKQTSMMVLIQAELTQ